MGKYKILLKAAWKKQKFPLVSIFFIMSVLVLCLVSSIVLYSSGRKSVEKEMDRLGFGNFTVWASNYPEELPVDISKVQDVKMVTVQNIIYAGYKAGGNYSDNEGQLMFYEDIFPYCFIDGNNKRYTGGQAEDGTVYVSPAMRQLYNVDIGDDITFEILRSNGNRTFKIAGFFEDAFMGSSMIDMKSFIISRNDFERIQQDIKSSSDTLARNGAMFHISKQDDSSLDDAGFYQKLIEETGMSRYTEFTYKKDSILNYMVLLQNILAGFMAFFSIMLLLICMVVVCHSLEMVIIQEKKDMALLKTTGLPSKVIQRVYLLLYGGSIVTGIIPGILPCRFVTSIFANRMTDSTGMLIDIIFPIKEVICIVVILVPVCILVIWKKTSKILGIHPVQVIGGTDGRKHSRTRLRRKYLSFDIAVREVMSSKRKYSAIFLTAAVLAFFIGMAGTINSWLGRNGEGLMDAFSVAGHDLGVQPFNSQVPMDEIERVINWYSPVTGKYELAMESVTAGGHDYTANILSDTSRFHILKGEEPDGNEILITDTVANELDINTGDLVNVSAKGGMAEYKVSGIYQCANGMGSNIGMSVPGYSKIGDVTGFIWCTHYILEDGSMRDYAYKYLEENYKGIDVHTNSWSGLDGIVMVMHIVLIVFYIVMAGIILLATALVAGKVILSEMADLAVYRSLGITSIKLRMSFAMRFLVVPGAGAAAGSILSALFSNSITGRLFRLFGIGEFNTVTGITGNIIPLLLVPLTFFCFAWLYAKQIKDISITKLIGQSEE